MTTMAQGLLKPSADLQSSLHVDPKGFPFRSELSLAPLIAFWSQMSTRQDSAKGALARIVGQEVAKAPELLGTIDDLTVLERHQELLDVLMAAVFPPALWEQEFYAALIPFHLRAFYTSPPMRQYLIGDDGAVKGRVNLDPQMVSTMRVAYAYALILRRHYGIDLDVDYPIIFSVPDPDTGLDRHFRILFDWRFVEVDAIGGWPTLDETVRQRLHSDILDPDLLREVLPPERFVMRGVTIFRALDVTDQEVLSSLKRDLIDKESIISMPRFRGLEASLRTLFRRPDLQLGLAAVEGDSVLVLNYGSRHEHGCIFADSAHHRTSEFAGSVYECAVKEERPIIIEDVAALPDRTVVEEKILGLGVRTFVVAPLHYQDRVIGTLSLGSPKPDDLDATHLPKLHEVLPLFSMAVQRSMEELNGRIQTLMKEKFTAIHPVVEWRFRKAVLEVLEGTRPDTGMPDLQPIVFENVYPLYALSDIRGSSTERSHAIQADLLTQLSLARAAIAAGHESRRLPALDELLYRLDKQATRLYHGLKSGDEVEMISFLRSDVEALFDHLQAFGPGVQARIDEYRSALDPRLGMVHRRRKIFEESVTQIAQMISQYLDLEQHAAQTMFPHYFEKQKTDGVDHQIYVGGSLMEDGQFDPIYLRNLRLWQLMVTCGVAARADQLTATLPVPLRTTHLILVQQTPLSIRFRFDEKRFDVDGAYDIRYEIVKKRIDKALVRGTTERATQPGKIAIVYAQPAEAAEYRTYIEYLQHLGYLGAEVEDLDLEELQGVHGLRALRVTVVLKTPPDRVPLPAASEVDQARV
jgi:GAF domain-containing protein